MEKKIRAWAYCSIDAPEDIHGTLKGQRQQLMDYAEQMNFEVVGSSTDMGGLPLLERSGFQHFMDAVQTGSANALLIMSQHCLGSTSMQLAQFQLLTESHDITVYSPLFGRLSHCQ